MTEPTRQAVAAQNRSGKLTVPGKLKTAVDLMLYEGSRRADAAMAAGMTDHGLREAFKKPHVKAYCNAGLQVLRESERARNIRRLAEIRDTGNGTPAVNAVRALEQMVERDGEAGASGQQRVPGLTIVIRNQIGGVDNVIAPPACR
ncbi:hypothetical protein [Bradyrhizobium zhanjiangense]|uniref:hypothetical protein n=1 Tax=Bradyrhizobium zhanjiangense TaxID=1325107 RepID=UPI00100870DE|nr:hypothetical protein [Bradyrhizobium zhanjiangense]